MLDFTTISSTIDSVNRAAAALGVSPYGDDGLTFTRREFNVETKGAHVFWSLENLRDRHAVTVDHSKTFIHPASLIISIASVYTDIKRLKISAPMSEHDMVLMLQAYNPIAIFSSINAEIAQFFADNDVSAKNVDGCYCDRYDHKTTIHVGYITVVIQYVPEFEGLRYFYRFDLCGFLRRQKDYIKDAITGCEEQAAKYQQLADAKTAKAAKLRKAIANLSK